MALCELQNTELFFAHLAFHPCFTGVVSVQSVVCAIKCEANVPATNPGIQ